jgi:hypothetical protein
VKDPHPVLPPKKGEGVRRLRLKQKTINSDQDRSLLVQSRTSPLWGGRRGCLSALTLSPSPATGSHRPEAVSLREDKLREWDAVPQGDDIRAATAGRAFKGKILR